MFTIKSFLIFWYENRKNNSDYYYNREVHCTTHTKADFDMAFYNPYPKFFCLPTKRTIGMLLVTLSISQNDSQAPAVDPKAQNFLSLLINLFLFLFLPLSQFLIEFLWYRLHSQQDLKQVHGKILFVLVLILMFGRSNNY